MNREYRDKGIFRSSARAQRVTKGKNEGCGAVIVTLRKGEK